MAKRKSQNLGTLPPAMFDLETVSTPVRSQSEAGIDTKGYDPAWDDPDFCKTQPETIAFGGSLTIADQKTTIDRNGTWEGTSEPAIPENPGHPISFGKTLDALLSGGKSVTRRTWSLRHAQHFINRFDRGWKCQAFDKDRRYGGQLVGWLKLVQKPYRERLGDMPDTDVGLEGYPELSKTEFVDRFFQGDASKVVWVIRFEFTPLEPKLSPGLELADEEAVSEPEPILPAAESSTPVAVEVVAETPVIVDELSYEEERDRLHLERKVERAFYEAGKALRELRDRRLYRSTHKTFEGYCRDRFGFKRAHSYRLIEAAQVVDNLACLPEENPNNQMSPNGRQNPAEENLTTNGRQNPAGDEMLTNGRQTEMSPNSAQILPTSERQIRPLTKLEPDRQREVWQQAVTEAGGKVPSGRIVKDIVERMQQVESPPEQPTRAHHLTLESGGLVEVSCFNNPNIHARLGRIAAVKEKTVEVWLRDVETMTMNKHTLRHHQVEAVPMEREPGLQELCDRFSALREWGLDPFELEVLALLERSVVLTPVEMGYLEGIEEKR